ncbi:putative methyltransferase-domain-containing protein [Lyophyllum atratum]|nr:putative methyltransferase-domain-containing protein [Lyophyllum atratum]
MALGRELFDVLRAFASLVPPSKICFPKNLSPLIVHAFFLEQILLDPHFVQYPPSEQYQKIFWKWAIHHLENMPPTEACPCTIESVAVHDHMRVLQDFEIDARIYEHYLSLLPSGPAPGSEHPGHRDQSPQGLLLQKPPAPSYVTHFRKIPQDAGLVQGGEYETVTLLESRTTIESGTTGLRTWQASFVLSQYITKHPGLLKDKRILELGSGTGFLGIIITRLQQSSSPNTPCSALWLTDVNEDVLARCRDNIQMPCNRSSSCSQVHYSFLDWTDSQNHERKIRLKSLLQNDIDADLVLGADIIFDPSLIPALTGVLHLALQPGSSGLPKSALIAATIRNKETFEQFLQSVQRETLQVRELHIEAEETVYMQNIDSNGSDNVRIFQITL